MTERILPLLQAYLAGVYPERADLAVTNLISLNNGWESDVFAFTARWGPPSQRAGEDLILRIYPGENAYAKSAHEFRALSLLNRAGYPVPRVDLLERDASPFAKPFVIMERVRGRDMWAPMFHSETATKQRLMSQFCALFARLHALDWRPLVDDPAQYEPGGVSGVVPRQLSIWQALLGDLPVLPGFMANWNWLTARQPELTPWPAAVVHWDFHPNNLLLKEDGSAVVIDWTSFDITDPRFDLAWTLLLVGTNESMGLRAPILAEYERQSGRRVDDLPFFEAAAAIRRLVTVMVSTFFGADKLGMRPGAEEIMRRQAPATRRVYDLLLSITGLPIPEVEEYLRGVRS